MSNPDYDNAPAGLKSDCPIEPNNGLGILQAARGGAPFLLNLLRLNHALLQPLETGMSNQTQGTNLLGYIQLQPGLSRMNGATPILQLAED